MLGADPFRAGRSGPATKRQAAAAGPWTRNDEIAAVLTVAGTKPRWRRWIGSDPYVGAASSFRPYGGPAKISVCGACHNHVALISSGMKSPLILMGRKPGVRCRGPSPATSIGPRCLTAVSQTGGTALDSGILYGRPVDPDLRKRTRLHWPDALYATTDQKVRCEWRRCSVTLERQSTWLLSHGKDDRSAFGRGRNR